MKPDWRNRLLWPSSPAASRLILLSVAAVVMALLLVMTMWKSGMTVPAPAIVITGGFVARRQRSGPRAIALAYLLFLLVVVVDWAGADVLASRFSQADWNDFSGRRGAWDDAIGLASKFPGTGTGLNTYGVATLFYQRHELSWHYAQAHNDYLQPAVEGGLLLTIPAVLRVCSFILVVRRRFIEHASSTTYWLRIGAATGLTAIALQETVDSACRCPAMPLFAVLCAITLHRAPGGKKPLRLPSPSPALTHS